MNDNVLLLGGICIDRYHIVENYPTRGEDTLIKSEFNHIGGCALNVSKTLKNLGLNPIIYSAVTNDSYGKYIKNYLIYENLDSSCIFEIKDKKTGYCMIFVDSEGERTFMTYKGCEGYFDEKIIPFKLLDSINYIYLTGIYLSYEHNNLNLCNFLKKCNELGKKIIFDPGPLLHSVDKKILDTVLSLSYAITPSTGELESIKSILNIYSSNIYSSFPNLKYILETKGAEGCTLQTHEKTMAFPSYKADAIDTNGSGDSFIGGLIYGLDSKLNIIDTIKIASACGSINTEFTGPHGNFNLTDIKNRIEMNK